MLAVHLANGAASIESVRRPRRPRNYSLVRVLVAGVCNTDLELLRGYYGFEGRPGHEFVGVVEESDDSSLVGRRVVGEINLNCGRCDWCKRGLGRHCPTRTVLGIVKHPGSFAEFLTLPDENLHTVPASIPTEHAVFVEPLAAACRILDQVKIPRGAKVAVLGDGKLGLLVSQVLNANGAKVCQFGRHKEKLAIAARTGVATEIASVKMPVSEFEYVVDATGSAEGLRTAVQMAVPCGTVIMKSTVHGTVSIDTAPVIVNEITMVGSRCGRFEPALRLLKQGKINVADMLSAEYPLSEAVKAFEAAGQRGVMKVLLRPV